MWCVWDSVNIKCNFWQAQEVTAWEARFQCDTSDNSDDTMDDESVEEKLDKKYCVMTWKKRKRLKWGTLKFLTKNMKILNIRRSGRPSKFFFHCNRFCLRKSLNEAWAKSSSLSSWHHGLKKTAHQNLISTVTFKTTLKIFKIKVKPLKLWKGFSRSLKQRAVSFECLSRLIPILSCLDQVERFAFLT